MRSGKAPKRDIAGDPIYNSKLVTKIINKIMIDGKKTIAQKLVYKALEDIEKSGKNPLSVLETALSNIAPKMEVRPRRVGGASYQVPVEVRGERKESLAIRWLIAACQGRSNKEFHSFADKLKVELLEAFENKGSAIKKKEDIQRQADANKAFAHFRW